MAIDKSKLRKAEKLVSQGKLKPAVEAYIKVLRSDPDDPNICNLVGDLLVRLGETATALPYFRRAAKSLETSGFRTKAIATLRKAYRLAEDDSEIARDLATLLKREGLAADARSVLFELAFKKEKEGDIQEAKRIYYQVLEIDSHHVQSLIRIGEIAEREGNTDEESRIYARIIRNLAQSARYEEAVDMLDNLAPRFRGNSEIEKLRADIYMRVGRVEEASALLKNMRESFPDDPALLMTMAKVALRKGELDQAEAIYTKIVELEESGEDVDLLGAGLKIARKDLDGALKILQPHIDQILETTTESPAIVAIEEIVKQHPGYIPAMKKLQKIYTYLKDKQNLARILVSLTKAYESDGDYKLAIDIVEQLIGLEPGKLAHKNRLERLYELSGGAAMFENEGVTVENMNLPDSLDFSLDEEVSSEGLDPKVHRHLVEATVFLKFGLTKKARQQIKLALEIDEFEPRLHEKMGEIFLEEQETASAIREYEKARECWQRRNDSEKAADMENIIQDLSSGSDHRADVVLNEEEFEEGGVTLEFVDEEDQEEKEDKSKVEIISSSDPLQGKLAEAEYYIEQNFITAAQHLLEKLTEQYPGNKRVEALQETLRKKLKSEMDMTNMEDDLDQFFSQADGGEESPADQKAGEADSGKGSALKDMINLLEDEISEIGSLASKKAGELGVEQDVPLDGLFTHSDQDEYLRSALKEDAGKHYDMAAAYYDADLHDEAIQSFKIAAKNPAYYQRACLQLGTCYLSKNMENVAITWLQKCFTGGGDEKLMADALHQMAIIYQLQGEDDAFLNTVQQLESLDPAYPGLKTLKSLAESMGA